MNVLNKLVLFTLASFYGTKSEETYNIDLEPHLGQLEEMRHPSQQFDESRRKARDYIKTTFESYNLTTQFQNFTSKVSLHNSIAEVNGWNIIGESQSSNICAPVLLIGTYYDNTMQWNPLVETGASVASLLETSRIFQNRFAKTTQSMTVLFVAFDLNVKNYDPYATSGQPGSYFFVQKWLSQTLKSQRLLGAVILDSIAAFNEKTETQKVSDEIKKNYPRAYMKILRSGFKGNFLTMMFNSPNMELADTFIEAFKKGRNDASASFQVVDIMLLNNTKNEQRMWAENIWNNPVYDFWNWNSLPTMRLSDMVKDRIDTLARQRADYQLKDFWEGRRRKFVETTTYALINMILEYERSLRETASTTVVTEAATPETTTPKPETQSATTNVPSNPTKSTDGSSMMKMDPCLVVLVIMVLPLSSFRNKFD